MEGHDFELRRDKAMQEIAELVKSGVIAAYRQYTGDYACSDEDALAKVDLALAKLEAEKSQLTPTNAT